MQERREEPLSKRDGCMENNIYKVRCPESIRRNIITEAWVPGSKSVTNRALLLAAMAEGESTLHGCMDSEDAVYFTECLKTLGFPVEAASRQGLCHSVRITGYGGRIPRKRAKIYVGSAGTAARFLVAMLAFSEGEYVVDSSEQMKRRPMEPLIESLRESGAIITCIEEEGHFPLQIQGAKAAGKIKDSFSVNIDQSSQFLSALLIAAGTLKKQADIRVTGSHGLSYVDMTAKMMESFGVSVKKIVDGEGILYRISAGTGYQSRSYAVEPDMSAAAYFYGLAALLGTGVTVKGIHRHMLQGDVAFFEVLSKLGCSVRDIDGCRDKVLRYVSGGNEHSGEQAVDFDGSVVVTGPGDGVLTGGFTVNMSGFSDQALTLAAIAPFADGPVTITGIGHIRLQECDRLLAMEENLTALGIRTHTEQDSITIYPGTPKGCMLETYGDHRVAMSFALTGLRVKDVGIVNPSCCKKTFGEYFQILDTLLSELEEADNR